MSRGRPRTRGIAAVLILAMVMAFMPTSAFAAAPAISGNVFDELTDLAIPGAKVMLDVYLADEDTWLSLAETTTGENGEYEFDIDQVTGGYDYRLVASADGYVENMSDPVWYGGEWDVEVALYLTPIPDIGGTVTYSDKEGPAAYAEVYLEYDTGGGSFSMLRWTSADSDGKYAFYGLTPGTDYRVGAWADFNTYVHIGTDVLSFTGTQITGADIVVSPAPADVTGKVTSGDPAVAVAGMPVNMYVVSGWSTWWTGTAITDENGDYSFDSVGSGLHFVSVEAYGYHYYESRRFTADELPLTLDIELLPIKAIVSGFVTSAVTGDPIEDASVSVYGPEDEGGYWVAGAATDHEGLYTAFDHNQLGAGSYRVEASEPGYFSQSTMIEWNGETVEFPVDFALEPMPPVATHVTETVRVSLDAEGQQGIDENENYRGSRAPAVSADGKFAVFYSGNSFVAGDNNGERDWYRKNLETGEIDLVSAASDGSVSGYTDESSSLSGGAGAAGMSGDGRYVVFDSMSNTLDPDDTNGRADVFLRDMVAGTTVRVSQTPDGFDDGENSLSPVISRDGRYVAFYSGNAFVEEDTNFAFDWYRADMQTGVFELVSVATDGTISEGSDSGERDRASMSSDGRYITFDSWSHNLVPDDDGTRDVFLRDMTAGTTVLVSCGEDGINHPEYFGDGKRGSRSPAISGDGRYVVFLTGNRLLEADDNDGETDWYRKDMASGEVELVSVNPDGESGDEGIWDGQGNASMSDDGRYVSFATEAGDLVVGDQNQNPDIFLRDMKTGETSAVSVAMSGAMPAGVSDMCAMNADGSLIVYGSDADDIVVEDTNDSMDVFAASVTIDSPVLDVSIDPTEIELRKTVGGIAEETLSITNNGEDAIEIGDVTFSEPFGFSPETDISGMTIESGETIETSVMLATDIVGEYEGEMSIPVVSPVEKTFSVDLTGIVDAAPAGVTPIALAGADRFATSVKISQDAFPDGADGVVIATGENWPDALGGSALAGMLDGPVLLSRQSAIPTAVLDEITRLGASKAYVLGDTKALSKTVYNALVAKLGSANVVRIGGANRYATANLVAAEVVSLHEGSYDGKAFIATGVKFADALAASPIAAANGWPVYLSGAAGISDDTVAAMTSAGVSDCIVLGNEAAVPAGTVMVLDAAFSAVRISGADRYQTAARIAEYGVTDGGMSWDGVAITTGEQFPDALAGGAAQGNSGSVMLLSRTASLPTNTRSAILANSGSIHEVRFLGGLTALSQAVRDAVMAALTAG